MLDGIGRPDYDGHVPIPQVLAEEGGTTAQIDRAKNKCYHSILKAQINFLILTAMNKRKTAFIIIAILAILALCALMILRINAVNSGKPAAGGELGGGLILFYGSTCPHCIAVEKFMADNQIEEKIKIDKKEVFNDKANAALLGVAAQRCGLDTASIGVPFLWDGATARCLTGDSDIISFFEQKL